MFVYVYVCVCVSRYVCGYIFCAAIVSRQFIEMPRSRIEGLLASFPKLIGAADQHTFVETDAVRYVYQPLDDLYLVLVTNKGSNILQDISTLHLFARIVGAYLSSYTFISAYCAGEHCRSVNEREVSRMAFELLGLFDEIVSLVFLWLDL